MVMLLLDYVLYRCYLKDSEFAGNQQRAGQHYQLFIAVYQLGRQLNHLLIQTLIGRDKAQHFPLFKLQVGN